MNKTYNIYCDESTHLENDGMPYMIIAYVSTAYNQLKQHNLHFKKLKEKYKFKGEIKWTDVSKSMYPFYNEVINYFFATDLKFRAVIVDKNQIDNKRADYTYNDFYFRMYYQLLFHKMKHGAVHNIYLDIKDTDSQEKLSRLREILDNGHIIRNIQFIKSYESYLMQLTDLLMGAINYNLRDLKKVTAKTNLIEIIKSHSKIDLKGSTSKDEEKFNLFFIELQ